MLRDEMTGRHLDERGDVRLVADFADRARNLVGR
jgi:hypothetical protein